MVPRPQRSEYTQLWIASMLLVASYQVTREWRSSIPRLRRCRNALLRDYRSFPEALRDIAEGAPDTVLIRTSECFGDYD
jgi:hypothetical protein